MVQFDCNYYYFGMVLLLLGLTLLRDVYTNREEMTRDGLLSISKHLAHRLFGSICFSAFFFVIITLVLNRQELTEFTIKILTLLLKAGMAGAMLLTLFVLLKLIIHTIKNHKAGSFPKIKKGIYKLFPIVITRKNFLFGLTFTGASLLFLYSEQYVIGVALLIFGLTFTLFRDAPVIDNWLAESKDMDLRVSKLCRERYSGVYYLSMLCKIICLSYLLFFILWNFSDYSTFSEINLTKKSGSSDIIKIIQAGIIEIIAVLEPLYITQLILTNSLLVDFLIYTTITITETEIVLISVTNLMKRAAKLPVTAFLGGGVGSLLISASPAVTLPGVNESQIMFGRGYGYKTSLDWLKGTILDSSLDNATMQGLVHKYTDNKILDAKSYEKIMQDKTVTEQLNKTTTAWEQRILGSRRF